MNNTDSVTILRAPGLALTKTYTELPDGTREKGSLTLPRLVDPRSV